MIRVIDIDLDDLDGSRLPADVIRSIRDSLGAPEPEAKPEPMTKHELANALVSVMKASGLTAEQQAEAGWIAMQIAGGEKAARVVRFYAAVSSAKSCR